MGHYVNYSFRRFLVNLCDNAVKHTCRVISMSQIRNPRLTRVESRVQDHKAASGLNQGPDPCVLYFEP